MGTVSEVPLQVTDTADTFPPPFRGCPSGGFGNLFDGMTLPWRADKACPLQRGIVMKVAVDIATYPVIRDGDFYYPAVASLLSILHSGGIIVIFKSHGLITNYEQLLLEKLAEAFRGRIIVAADGRNTDMCIS